MPEARSQMSAAGSQRPDTTGRRPAIVVEGPSGGRGTGPIRHFTDLIVWQKAFDLGLRVFEFSRSWPREEKFALIDQVRRSSRSVSANICEAWGKRRYEAHFVSKLSDSDTELLESENWLMFASHHGYLSTADFDSLHEQMREIGRMLGSIMQNPTPFLLRDARRPI
jgi:four helix bundle protein